MTPGARISAAIEILDQVLSGMAAEQALTRWSRQARYAGSKDRAAVRDHVFQALRCRRSYAVLGGGSDGRAIMIGALKAQNADLPVLFSGEGHAPAPLGKDEMDQTPPELTAAEEADLPDWLWQVFVDDLGPRAMETAKAQKGRAPIALRVSLNMINRSQAVEAVAEDAITAEPVPECPTALIVTEGERKIRNARAYLSGAVELQDVSSQSAMARVSVRSSARVLDYCAGGGGKTLALASSVPPGADVQFFAHDSDPSRMADLPTRAQRAGASVHLLRPEEISKEPPFDVVLCDVPCSGSGTWRRGPEAKWRLTRDRLKTLLEIQKDILRSACDLLADGGQLIYTTCSVLARENNAQVNWFCRQFPEFEVQDQHIWPVSDIGDGFYFAALGRKA